MTLPMIVVDILAYSREITQYCSYDGNLNASAALRGNALA